MLTRLGWLTTRVANPPIEQARGLAYLFRGTAAVFTPGFGILADTLRTAGIWTEDLRSVGDGWACRHVLDLQKQGMHGRPIILIGHSRGGRRALLAASRLQQAGIAVDLLICIDVAFPPLVPGNVKRAIHLYRSHWRLYPARPLQPAAGVSPLIENLDLDQSDSPISSAWLHHLNITASAALRTWVVEQVVQLSGKRGLPE